MEMWENKEAKLFSERLNQALDWRKYPAHGKGRVNYLQEIFHISRAGANKWLHGKAIPHRNKRIEICQKLGVSQHWLERGVGSPFEKDPKIFNANELVHSIPLLTLDEAYDYKNHISDKEIELLIVSNALSFSAIAVKNVGDAMMPRFNSNAILIVDLQGGVNDGDFVLAKTRVIPEAIFRQYIIGAAGSYLVAANPKFESIPVEEGMIIGKVIEVRSQV